MERWHQCIGRSIMHAVFAFLNRCRQRADSQGEVFFHLFESILHLGKQWHFSFEFYEYILRRQLFVYFSSLKPLLFHINLGFFYVLWSWPEFFSMLVQTQMEEAWVCVCLLSLHFYLYPFTPKRTRSLFSYLIKIHSLIFKPSIHIVTIFLSFSCSVPFIVSSHMIIPHLSQALEWLAYDTKEWIRKEPLSKLNGATSFLFAHQQWQKSLPS